MINVAVPVVVGTVFVVVGQKEKNKQRFFNLERRFAFVYLFLSRRSRGRRYSNGSRVNAIRQAGQVTRISPRHRRLVYGVSVCVCVWDFGSQKPILALVTSSMARTCCVSLVSPTNYYSNTYIL